jgi:hypothetical protein
MIPGTPRAREYRAKDPSSLPKAPVSLRRETDYRQLTTDYLIALPNVNG